MSLRPIIPARLPRLQVKERLADLGWLMKRTARSLGLPGWMGVILLGASAWLWTVQIPRTRIEQADRQAELDRWKHRQAQPVAQAELPKPLDVLRMQLETQDHFAEVVDDLNASLAAANVTLVDATLGAPTWKDLPSIGRIEMTVHAKGTYPAIKTAIGKLLDHHLGLGLEQMALEKTEPANPALDAQLRFVYFFKQ